MLSPKFSPFSIMVIAELLHNSRMAMCVQLLHVGAYGIMLYELNQKKKSLCKEVECVV